jgi:NADH-quinone oxidoreductase subunit N
MSPADILKQIETVLPANVLLLAGVVVLTLGLFNQLAASRNVMGGATILGMILAAVSLMYATPADATASALFECDRLFISASWLTLLGGGLIVMIGWDYVPARHISEYYSCMLFMLSGLMYTSAAIDLTSLFLGLELISIPTTVLLGVVSSKNAGRESTLKYFTLSAFASGIFLFGCSYLYGAAGSTSLDVIISNETNVGLTRVGLAIAVCGLFFRLTAVPFHFYAPDVFAGASLAVVGGLSFLPKVAGVVGIYKLLVGSTPDFEAALGIVPLLLVAAVVTMTLGNCAALRQTSIRRVLAYSGVAHSGYLLAGLACVVVLGQGAAILTDYLAAYAVMTLAVFAVLTAIEQPLAAPQDDSLKLFNGLYQRSPFLAIAATIALLSQIGLPPTAGFWAKLQVFASAIGADRVDFQVVAFIMAINAAIGAVVYLSFVNRMFSAPDANATAIRSPGPAPAFACLGCSILTIVWFFFP